METLSLLISTFGGVFIFYAYSKSLKKVNYNCGNDFISKFFSKFMTYILIYLFITIWMIFFLGLYFSEILQGYFHILPYIPILVILTHIGISMKVKWHRVIIRKDLLNVSNFFIIIMMAMLSAVILAGMHASAGVFISLSKYINDNSVYDFIKNVKAILIAISDFLFLIIASVLMFYVPIKIYLYNIYKKNHIAEILYTMKEKTEMTYSEIKDINSNQHYISFVDISKGTLICIPSDRIIQVKHVNRNTLSVLKLQTNLVGF